MASFRTNRKLFWISNGFIVIFSVIFMGVGSATLQYGKAFASKVEQYCSNECAQSSEQVVGCNCESSSKSTIPMNFFLAPSIGVIVIGVLLFLCAILGYSGSIWISRKQLACYAVAMPLVILLQFCFGCAAIAVATGSSASVAGGLYDVLDSTAGRMFDWSQFSTIFPAKCYAGKTTVVLSQGSSYNDSTTDTYYHPLCRFYGDCEFQRSHEELSCCTALLKCDSTKAIFVVVLAVC
mmetsp:Transcript_40221/g.126596  ORF Transcript_40221/g.126596 Transcript_40221/m.126596 type:complete len:237 (+) Transcript_40221:91-801(+)